MSTSYDAHRSQVEQARDRSTGRFGSYSAGESNVSLEVGDSPGSGSDSSTMSEDYVESFASITRNWPSSIEVTSEDGPAGRTVTAVHHPDMGSTVEFHAETGDGTAERPGQWRLSVDGEEVSSGGISDEDDVLTAEMHQDAFVGQAMDEDALSGAHDGLTRELSPRGYTVSTGWGDFIDEHTQQHQLRIDEPDGGTWEVLQHRHDPSIAHMDGEGQLELFEAEHGSRDYSTQHYVSRIRADGTRESLEGEDPHETMDEAISQIRSRTGNFDQQPRDDTQDAPSAAFSAAH